jgi:thiol-disulfide isomerase/thioredoxin
MIGLCFLRLFCSIAGAAISTGESGSTMQQRSASIFIAVIITILFFTAAIHAQNERTKLEGQVVCCAECWAEADRTKVEFGTAEDLLKAKSCVEGGDPTLLAVGEGDKFKLYQLATGKFRLPGKNWLEFVGKRVAIEGTIQPKKETSIIRVDSLQVLANSLAQREAAQLAGRQIDLKLKDLSGIEQSLAALKGRIVILNFWATYCIPCRKEMPDLAAIQIEFAALGVQVVGASVDDEEDKNKVLQFIKETKVYFPIWIGASVEHMMRFGLGTALPGTVVIGRDGRVVKVISGVVDQAVLRKEINALLAVATATSTAKIPRKTEVSAVPS